MIAVRCQGLVADADYLAWPNKVFLDAEGKGKFRRSQRNQVFDCGPEGGFPR